MPASYEGVTIQVRLSSARPGEAEFRGMTVEEANEELSRRLTGQLLRKFPGATVAIEIGGDKPEAQVTGTDRYDLARAIQYDAERAALTLKFAFSTLGAGLEP